jgi:hypothetical protein
MIKLFGWESRMEEKIKEARAGVSHFIQARLDVRVNML